MFQSRFTELLGNGIFNADGGLWKMQRKTASHMFSVKTMREDMCTVFQSHCDKLINVLGKLTSEKEFIDIVRSVVGKNGLIDDVRSKISFFGLRWIRLVKLHLGIRLIRLRRSKCRLHWRSIK